jgi:hypothetical protein
MQCYTDMFVLCCTPLFRTPPRVAPVLGATRKTAQNGFKRRNGVAIASASPELGGWDKGPTALKRARGRSSKEQSVRRGQIQKWIAPTAKEWREDSSAKLWAVRWPCGHAQGTAQGTNCGQCGDLKSAVMENNVLLRRRLARASLLGNTLSPHYGTATHRALPEVQVWMSRQRDLLLRGAPRPAVRVE